MTTAIGVVITDHIVAGRLEDHRLVAKPLRYPAVPHEPDATVDALSALPPTEIVDILASQIAFLAKSDARPLDAIGVAVPGIVRNGVVEDSPNLTQMKGMRLAADLTRELTARGITAPVYAANDADAIAAGVAATHGRLEKLTR